MAHAELGLEAFHVGHIGAPEGVDALVVIAHGEDATTGVREQLEPLVLQWVGVLKLINQDMLKPRPVVVTNGIGSTQQFHRAQHELAKVHHALALALVVVGLVELNEPAVVAIGVVDIGRPQALLLGAVDEGLHLLGRVLLIIHAQAFHQPLDGRELVLAVENLKGGRQGCISVVGPQKPIAQAMEGAHPHALEVHLNHSPQPCEHLACSLVGEGHRQNAQGTHLARGDQPGNAGGEHTGLAAASPRQNEGGLGWKGHRLFLRWVEALKQGRDEGRRHPCILRLRLQPPSASRHATG